MTPNQSIWHALNGESATHLETRSFKPDEIAPFTSTPPPQSCGRSEYLPLARVRLGTRGSPVVSPASL